jgi:hypothetical protein
MSVAEIFEQILQLPPQDQQSLLAMMQQQTNPALRPEDEVFEDPSPEEILADIRASLEDYKAGRYLSLEEALAELRAEFGFDGH